MRKLFRGLFTLLAVAYAALAVARCLGLIDGNAEMALVVALLFTILGELTK